jgi:hypothetical protein
MQTLELRPPKSGPPTNLRRLAAHSGTRRQIMMCHGTKHLCEAAAHDSPSAASRSPRPRGPGFIRA